MLRYYSDLLFEYEDFMIQQFIIYIGKDKCSMKNEIKRDKISYNYDIIDMKNIACEDFLQSKDPSAISLSILCDFKDRDKQEVVNTILRKLISTCKDETEFRSHLKMVEVLSTNRDLEDKVRKGEEMLTVDIERIPSYNIGLERGIKKGIEEGIERGIERGIEKGIEKGIKEGQIEAKINIAKNALRHGFDVKTVISLTGLSKEEVLEIAKSI